MKEAGVIGIVDCACVEGPDVIEVEDTFSEIEGIVVLGTEPP